MSPTPALIMLDPGAIRVGGRLRHLDEKRLADLIPSVKNLGIRTPISIKTDGDDRKLVAGLHRLEAAIVTRQQAIMDEHDAKAAATIKQQQADALRLAAQAQSSADDRDSLLAQIKDAAHEHDITPITITVSGAPVPPGWDPVVLAGMRCLRGVQLGRNLSAPECRIQGTADPGRPGIAGDPAGANPARPSAEQQADFLAFAWRLRDWGSSCYADKRAIVASQQAGVVTP